jgi:hypothetical protein
LEVPVGIYYIPDPTYAKFREGEQAPACRQVGSEELKWVSLKYEKSLGGVERA